MTLPIQPPRTPPLLGPMRVKTAFRDFLQGRLPLALVVLRDLWNLSDEQLPDPISYMRNPPLELDGSIFPRIAVAVTKMPTHHRVEPTDDGQWANEYVFTLYTWHKAEANMDAPPERENTDNDQQWERVLDERDLMIAALRFTLLDGGLSLGVEPIGTMAVQEDSLTEDYTDPTPVRGARWVAGGTLAGRVRVFESIEGVRIGTVQQVEVDVVGQPPPGFGQPESLTGFNLNVHPALQ